MRGADTFTESLFTRRRLENFIPAYYPLRLIRQMANAALGKMEGLLTRSRTLKSKVGDPAEFLTGMQCMARKQEPDAKSGFV